MNWTFDQNTMTTTKFTFPLILLLSLLLNSVLFAEKNVPYIVVSDDILPLYKRIISGINIETEENFIEFSLEGNSNKAENLFKRINLLNPQIIIAIGPKSANAAKKINSVTTTVIYCLVPRPENYDLNKSNLIGIGLEFSFNKQLSAFKTILPHLKKIGIIYNPDYSKNTIKLAKKAMDNLGLTLVPIPLYKPGDAQNTLSKFKTQVDALWMISDETALNLNAWEATKEFCLQNKIPFLALDDGFVVRGALLSFSVDYVWIGRQAVRLANRISNQSLSVKDLNIIEPEGLNLSVNMSTAKTIGLSADLPLNLLNYAAKNQHTVQAFN